MIYLMKELKLYVEPEFSFLDFNYFFYNYNNGCKVL